MTLARLAARDQRSIDDGGGGRSLRLGNALVAASLLGCLALTLSLAGSAIGAASLPRHAPFAIHADGDFTTPSATNGCKCVTSGAGTAQDPYVIGPWSINNSHGAAVTIDGGSLTKSFDLHNLVIAGNNTPDSEGIVLGHVSLPSSVSGSQTSIQTVGTGILVQNSTNVTLDGGGANASAPESRAAPG